MHKGLLISTEKEATDYIFKEHKNLLSVVGEQPVDFQDKNIDGSYRTIAVSYMNYTIHFHSFDKNVIFVVRKDNIQIAETVDSNELLSVIMKDMQSDYLGKLVDNSVSCE